MVFNESVQVTIIRVYTSLFVIAGVIGVLFGALGLWFSLYGKGVAVILLILLGMNIIAWSSVLAIIGLYRRSFVWPTCAAALLSMLFIALTQTDFGYQMSIDSIYLLAVALVYALGAVLFSLAKWCFPQTKPAAASK